MARQTLDELIGKYESEQGPMAEAPAWREQREPEAGELEAGQ